MAFEIAIKTYFYNHGVLRCRLTSETTEAVDIKGTAFIKFGEAYNLQAGPWPGWNPIHDEL